jgi:hypothetical protein
MTIDEVEDVVRALTAVAENLQAIAKQSMQEAFTQVRAYAGECGCTRWNGRPPAKAD